MGKLTVQMVMDALIAPVGTLAQTVDTLLFGDPSMEVTGIVSAFMPTQYVLEQALEREANLLIAHEGLFFAHQDDPVGGRGGEVYLAKKKLIEDSGLAVFRFHDYAHRYKPDGITEGLIRELGWERYVTNRQPAASLLEIPPASLGDIVGHVKHELGLSHVRFMGDPEMVFTSLGVLAGYRGGAALAVPLYESEQADLVIYGEGQEWETPEYVRDALHQGRRRGLIVLGHAESEIPGMKALASSLAAMFPEVPVHHLQDETLFQLG